MLNTSNTLFETARRWESLQQPMHGSGCPSDYLRLLAALDEGWQIMDTAEYLARGNNADGCGYQLTLIHPRRLLTREWDVMRSPEMDALLAFECVPGFNG
jgi:hypothetical protein